MRRVTKAICLALSLAMLINLAGFEALAADVNDKQADVTGGEQKNESIEDTDSDTNQKTDDTDDGQDAPSDDVTDNLKGDAASQPEDNQTEGTGNESLTEPSEPADKPENEPVKDEVQAQQEETENTSLDQQAAVAAQSIVGLKAERVAGSGNQLKVSWNAVSEADNYQVIVSDYPSGANVQEYNNVEVTNCIVTVTQGKKYYIEVTAQKADNPKVAVGKIPAVLLANPAVTVKAGGTNINLSWSAVAGADKYQVAYGSRTENVSGNSYNAQSLKYNTKYDFSVQAVCVFTESGATYAYTSDLAKVSALTTKEKPDKVKKLTGMDGDECAILTWSKAARADSYNVYRYNASKKRWEVVKQNVKKLAYTDKKLKQGKTYKYRVAAANNGGTGKYSPTVSVKVKKTPGRVRTIGYKAVVKSRAPLFTAPKSKKKVKYLKAGTRVTTIDYKSRRYAIKLSDGKTYWLSKDRLRFTASIWTTKEYSSKTKEDFVNKKGYKSKTKYLIWVNQYTQRTVIYKGSKGKWKIVRSGQCATGTHKAMTPKKTVYLTYRKKGRYKRTQYQSPIVYFTGGNAFHSRLKSYSGGYVDATIGRPKSHGCVRLMQPEIDYIYKYCPRGTTVVIY